jgi:hypothetical protein
MWAEYLRIRLSGPESEGSNSCNLVALVDAAAAERHLERHPEVVGTSRAKQTEVRPANADDRGSGTTSSGEKGDKASLAERPALGPATLPKDVVALFFKVRH